MEKKNTILLTVIAVATLLVAVVGATFAYFTASSSVTGDGNEGTVNTATNIGSVAINQTDIAASNNTIYPGTMNYVGTIIQATKTDTTENFTLDYSLTGTVSVTAAFAHDITWKLYKVAASETSPVSCQPVTETATATGTQYSQSCTLGKSLTGDSVGDGSLVAKGTLTAGETSSSVSYADGSVDTDGGSDYYYLVVEYPNKQDSQNADQGKDIKMTINKVAITNTTQK